MNVIDEHAPVKKKLIKQESVPYMNGCLRKAMYQRNMARNKFRKYGKQYWQENRRQRNLVASLRKKSLRNYFSQRCIKKDKTFWKTISPFMTNKHNKSGDNIILKEGDNTIVDKQRVLMHGHQGWNVRHGLCHIYMIYVYIWVVYSFCLFCCLFIIVKTQFVVLYKPCKPKPKPSTYDPPGQPPPGRDPKTDT